MESTRGQPRAEPLASLRNDQAICGGPREVWARTIAGTDARLENSAASTLAAGGRGAMAGAAGVNAGEALSANRHGG